MQRGALALVGLLLATSLASCDGGTTAPTTTPAPAPQPSVSSTTVVSITTLATTTNPAEVMPPMRLPWFPGQWELAQAWARWESQGLDSYQFDIRGGTAWMSLGSYNVFVSGDDVSVVALSEGPHRGSKMFGPVERLFSLIESNPSEYLTVEYDPAMGYPVSIAYDAPAIDEEWSIWVSDLQPFAGELPPQTLEPPESRLQWMGYNYVHLIVEVTVGLPQRYIDTRYNSGWIVGVDDPIVHYIRRPRWKPADSLEVLDLAHGGPRILRDHEGERLILFLNRHAHSTWYVMWAARYTEHGLVFVGPEAEFTTLNDELPRLCDFPRLSDSVVRNPDGELQLLIRWAEELASVPRNGDRETALPSACATFPQLDL